MAIDIIAELGPIFLGSRLKRLAERLQAGAARIIAETGLPLQPGHMGLLAALDRSPMSVGQLVDAIGTSQPGVTRGIGQLVALGLVDRVRGTDQRQRRLRLTAAGEAAMARIKFLIWPRVGQAMGELCAGLSGSFIDQIAALEQAIGEHPLDTRAAALPPARLTVHEYRDELAQAFHDINAEWIGAMFELEPADREVLETPRGRIIDPGGVILFVASPALGIIGTGALRKTGHSSFELTKMGVRASARGLKAGETLLAALLARAEAMAIEELYLMTNSKCEAAIHLYEKLGFRHDAEIMAKHGRRYRRCDVAMRWRFDLR